MDLSGSAQSVLKALLLCSAVFTAFTLCYGQVNTHETSDSSVTSEQKSNATLTGVVRDGKGLIVPAVRIKLRRSDDLVVSSTTSDDQGVFVFSGLPTASYRVEIEGGGDIVPLLSDPIILADGERRELPIDVVRLPTANASVDVVATLNQVAQAQLQQEEQQRIFGILPNYYTSYIWDALPLPKKLKYQLAFRTSIDPLTFFASGLTAGVEQARDTFPGYGQGAEGYAKRYGGTYADTISGRMLGSAVFPALLHQDPRYFYRGSGSIRSRALYAIISTVACRGDNGKLEPNYSHLFGSFAAAGLSNLYRSPSDRKVGITISNGLIIFGGGAAVNLMREFLSRRLTPRVPSFAHGKP
jgi:hypothetical protein